MSALIRVITVKAPINLVLFALLSILVDGGFSEWGNWNPCSTTCGNSFKTRSRECNFPLPQNGGKDCEGVYEESVACNVPQCPSKFMAMKNAAFWIESKCVDIM